jgi:hypothetical protein
MGLIAVRAIDRYGPKSLGVNSLRHEKDWVCSSFFLLAVLEALVCSTNTVFAREPRNRQILSQCRFLLA